MLVDTYRSEIDASKLLSVPAGTDISQLKVSELDADYGKLAAYQTATDLDPDEPSRGFNNAAIIQDIIDHGFCIHFVATSVTHDIPGGS
jgi:hypothetical protein